MELLPCSGYWINSDLKCFYNVISEYKMTTHYFVKMDYPLLEPNSIHKLIPGDFGPVSVEILEKSGLSNYNLKIISNISEKYCVMNSEGTKIYFLGLSNKIEILEWISTEHFSRLNKSRKYYYDLSCPYPYLTVTVRDSKVIWISGTLLYKISKYFF